MKKISDIGERKLIERINKLSNRITNHNICLDDAAPIYSSDNLKTKWVTTDPSPIPSYVQKIGMGNYYHTGWLLVVKSISDLAAMGANPDGLLIATELSPELKIEDFDELFKGIIDCAKAHETVLLGGNIKENRSYNHAVAFAIGSTNKIAHLSRRNVEQGDIIALIDKDEVGMFWAAIATYLNENTTKLFSNNAIKNIQKYAKTPYAKIKQGKILLNHFPEVFCMDSSDGLISTFEQMTSSKNVSVYIDLNEQLLRKDVIDIANASKSDPLLWTLGWGSYHLVIAMRENEYDDIYEIFRESSVELIKIGKVEKGDGSIYFRQNGEYKKQINHLYINGEQFKSESFWGKGIESYSNFMLNGSIKDLF